MIVLDTTVLVYAVGDDADLREPCQQIVRAIAEGKVSATTTVEVIQEFAHVRGRRRSRDDAAEIAARYAVLLAPLLRPEAADVVAGLSLWREHAPLGCFDAVLAATARRTGASALVSADAGVRDIPGIQHVDPTDPAAVADLVGQ